MRIDIEELKALKARLAEINSIPLKDVEWCEAGERVDVPPATVEEWRYIGLSNADFIMTGFYKDPSI